MEEFNLLLILVILCVVWCFLNLFYVYFLGELGVDLLFAAIYILRGGGIQF